PLECFSFTFPFRNNRHPAVDVSIHRSIFQSMIDVISHSFLAYTVIHPLASFFSYHLANNYITPFILRLPSICKREVISLLVKNASWLRSEERRLGKEC